MKAKARRDNGVPLLRWNLEMTNAALAPDTYQAMVTIEAGVVGSAVQIPVTLLLAGELNYGYLPLVVR